MPQRYQRSRQVGAKLPAGVICVTRPGKFGNPFVSVEQFEYWLERLLVHKDRSIPPESPISQIQFEQMCKIADAIEELRGKDLACWCELSTPEVLIGCHADVLIRFANR